jgi:hypothetical protein
MAALVINVVKRLGDVLALTESLQTAEKAKVALIKQEANNGFMVSSAPRQIRRSILFLTAPCPILHLSSPSPQSLLLSTSSPTSPRPHVLTSSRPHVLTCSPPHHSHHPSPHFRRNATKTSQTCRPRRSHTTPLVRYHLLVAIPNCT